MIHRDTNTLTFFQCQDMAHASCVLTHGSCVNALSPFSVMTHASCGHSRGMRHASCVMRPLTWHASCVMRHASTNVASIQPLHSAPRRRRGISHRLDPLGQCPINALHFAPLSYMARGNRVVLPPAYGSMERKGAQKKNDNRPRRSMEHRGLLSSLAREIRKRPA